MYKLFHPENKRICDDKYKLYYDLNTRFFENDDERCFVTEIFLIDNNGMTNRNMYADTFWNVGRNHECRKRSLLNQKYKSK